MYYLHNKNDFIPSYIVLYFPIPSDIFMEPVELIDHQ